MLTRNWFELALVAATAVAGIILHVRYRRKVDELDGFEGIVEEFGELELLEGFDWQMEMFRELEKK